MLFRCQGVGRDAEKRDEAACANCLITSSSSCQLVLMPSSQTPISSEVDAVHTNSFDVLEQKITDFGHMLHTLPYTTFKYTDHESIKE